MSMAYSQHCSVSKTLICPGVLPKFPRRKRSARGPALVHASTSASPEPDKSQPSSSLSSNVVIPSTSLAHLWPNVSWNRYHVQVLFVDRTDTVRARLAAGLFERCAEWNGYGRTLCPWTCGLSPASGPSRSDISSLSRLAALAARAASLEVGARTFSRPPEAFELPDLDRYDLLLACDSGVLGALQEAVEGEYPPGSVERDYYLQKLCLLTTFSHYESEGVLTARGGSALLPARLSGLLRGGGLQTSKAVVDIPSPDLTASDGAQQWEAAAAATTLATASLVKYLIDAYPDNMPHWDPVD